MRKNERWLLDQVADAPKELRGALLVTIGLQDIARAIEMAVYGPGDLPCPDPSNAQGPIERMSSDFTRLADALEAIASALDR